MKQAKEIWKQGLYVAAAFGLHETANEFLYFCTCIMFWARPQAQAQVQISQTHAVFELFFLFFWSMDHDILPRRALILSVERMDRIWKMLSLSFL